MRAIVAMFCCVVLSGSSVVSAQERRESTLELRATRSTSTARDGVLRRALVDVGSSRHAMATLDPARSVDSECRGNWAQRHPVWTGALVGYAVAFTALYAAFADDDDRDALLTPIGPGAPAMVFGGIGAGVGALAGWGVGRNRDNDACASAQITRSASMR